MKSAPQNLQIAKSVLMNTEIKQIARELDLTKELDAGFLSELSLEQLQTFKKEIHARAVAVIGEISALKAHDDFERSQYERRMFRSEIYDENETLVFCHECEPRFEKYKVFVPGGWFQNYLDELHTLRALYAENRAEFSSREKGRIIYSLTGGNRRRLNAAA